MTAVLSYLTLEDVLELARTCRAFRRLPKELQATKYNINPDLKGFFKDPKEFRSVQAQCNAVIVEGFARKFFARTTADQRLLDIYVVEDHYKTFRRYLKKEGYKLHSPDDDREWFRKKDAEKVRWTIVIESEAETVVDNLFKWAMTTACLHLITWNKAYALFPYTTFVRKECYLVKELADDVADYCVRIEEKEHVRVKSISWKQKGISGNCDTLTRRRRIGDEYTWKIQLNTNGVVPSEIPDRVLECSAFNLAPKESEFSLDGGPAMRYEIRYDVWTHASLRYQYVTLKQCEDETKCDARCIRPYCHRLTELSRRLDEGCLTSVMKLPSEKRPEGLQRFNKGKFTSAEMMDSVTKSGTWEYCDDEAMDFLEGTFMEQCEADVSAERPWGEGRSRKRKWEIEDWSRDAALNLKNGLRALAMGAVVGCYF
tara:strand:+ start:12322 stop:13605 length:1284 start_codon:yes stop_codon:yes gene_type:complete